MATIFKQRFIAYLSALCLALFSFSSFAEAPSTLMAVAAQGGTAQSMVSNNLGTNQSFFTF